VIYYGTLLLLERKAKLDDGVCTVLYLNLTGNQRIAKLATNGLWRS
jgi:hypothetical protein